MAQGHRRRARGRRPDRHPADAHRTHRPPRQHPHGRQPVAPSAIRPAGAMFTASGPQEMPTPVLCRRRRSRRPSTTSAALRRPPSRQAPTAWRSTAPTATWCTSSCPTTPTSAPTATAVPRQPHPLRRRGRRCRGRRDRRRPHRPAHLPGNPYNDIAEADTAELYPALLRALSPLGLAYLHVMHAGDEELLGTLRALWPTTLILNRAAPTCPPAPRTSTTARPTLSPSAPSRSPTRTWSSGYA